MAEKTLLTQEYIQNALSELEEHGEISVEGIFTNMDVPTQYAYDDEDGKMIPFSPVDFMTKDWLKSKIQVPNIPVGEINIDNLVDLLFDKADKNLFVTLENIWIIWDETDLAAVEEVTGDAYAYEVLDEDMIGVMWFERNTVLVNLKRIYELSNEVSYDSYSTAIETSIGLVCTIVHELRHLMLDTNVILSEDEYPLEESAEENVEQYGREFCDNNYCSNIFSPMQ